MGKGKKKKQPSEEQARGDSSLEALCHGLADTIHQIRRFMEARKQCDGRAFASMDMKEQFEVTANASNILRAILPEDAGVMLVVTDKRMRNHVLFHHMTPHTGAELARDVARDCTAAAGQAT
jgi:hypothetical protein